MIGRSFKSVRIFQACPKRHKPLTGNGNLEFFKSFNLSTGATYARVYRECSIERLKDLKDLYYLYIDQRVSFQPEPVELC